MSSTMRALSLLGMMNVLRGDLPRVKAKKDREPKYPFTAIERDNLFILEGREKKLYLKLLKLKYQTETGAKELGLDGEFNVTEIVPDHDGEESASAPNEDTVVDS